MQAISCFFATILVAATNYCLFIGFVEYVKNSLILKFLINNMFGAKFYIVSINNVEASNSCTWPNGADVNRISGLIMINLLDIHKFV